MCVLFHVGLDLGRSALHLHEEEEEVGGGEEVVVPLLHVFADLLERLVEEERDLGERVPVQVLEVVARLPVDAARVALEYPRVEDELLHGDAALGVHLEQVVEQLGALGREPRGHVVLARLDLLVEQVDVVVVEGQVAAEQRVQQHAHAPQVGLGAQVVAATDELGRRVGGRAAARAQQVVHAALGLGA